MILVTGGAGFIGSNLAEALVKRGDRVTILDDFSVGDSRNIAHIKARVVHGSVCDFNLVHELVSQADVTFHLAVKCLEMCNDNPILAHDVNVGGTFNVCYAAAKANKKVVYISSSEVYGSCRYKPMDETHPTNPQSIYGVTKLMGEEYVKFFHKYYNVPAVIIRPFNSYGPNLRDDRYSCVITKFIRAVEHGESPIIEGTGEQSRDWTYVSDTVNGILLLSELNDAQIMNVGTGTTTTIKDLAQKIMALSGKNLPLKYAKTRINDVKALEADFTYAQSYGYEPTISLEEGLRFYMKWLREYG